MDFKVKQVGRDRRGNRRTNAGRLWVQYESIDNVKNRILENELRENNERESQSLALAGRM